MKEPKKGTGKLSKIRKQPGKSNAFKYVGTKAGKAYAGPDKTFPIGDISHARNALSRAHFAKDPAAIKSKVYSKYPGLKKRAEKKK